MSISRLASVVLVLVLGTALSVWWYLQVPIAMAAGPANTVQAEFDDAPPAQAPELEAPLDLRRTTAPLAAPTTSERWSRRTGSGASYGGPARVSYDAAGGEVGAEHGTSEACRREPCSKSEPAPAAYVGPGQT